ncbi:hypothetical protein FUT69_08405 [Xylella taiwanensis]|uniref:DUF3693 domain-containing protein n=1 Tax=Xylella taiwanensis TaxID=1444770 RepID=A0ABS8TYA9_9GAMM|nr:DUF3693 domain-containing protein [Xylella taiwanensis]MCD8456525.1 DUF3693 domain-containing protein [Xylella taiwanensis]MCD8458932.1 DUF3693 domain-containing protein [Xylella taiwanensis]MCD8461070.1 DUF3693 domain-containing protein [Xylella taiwanensis]MCD8462871.1 DUF3693 domain-containing protein [Xylella taiwanensis]MCD8465575.1 DUF3693 domain-containing protein [Xylella taiwanensis]
MYVKKLIELAVQRLDRSNVHALAERLEIAHGVLYEWRNGTKPIPDERIRQLAKIAGEDAGHWLLLIRSEQDKGDLGREWAKLYKRLTTTVATLVVGVGVSLPHTSQASMTNHGGVEALKKAGGPCWNRTSDQRIKSQFNLPGKISV